VNGWNNLLKLVQTYFWAPLPLLVRDAARDRQLLMWLLESCVWWWFENWIVDASKYERFIFQYFVLFISFEK
jgi:hypothetical protein